MYREHVLRRLNRFTGAALGVALGLALIVPAAGASTAPAVTPQAPIAPTSPTAPSPPNVVRPTPPVIPDAVHPKQPTYARTGPSYRAHAIQLVDYVTMFTNTQAILPVIGHATDSHGKLWYRVELPTRPNGLTGWLPASATSPRKLHWAIAVSLSRKTATIFQDGAVNRVYRVVVGKSSTPTPTGHFFVVEKLRLYTSWAHGVWALATSAHSDVLQEFDGGNGQIALHARGLLSDPLGSAASHGCIRFADASAAWLAAHISNGTRITVSR